MADDFIKGTKGKYHPAVAPKTAETGGTEKSSKAPDVQQPTISRTTGDGYPLGKIPPETAIDANNPTLVPPNIFLSAEESKNIRESLNKKFQAPLSLEGVEEIINQGKEAVNKRLKAAEQKIEEVRNSNRNPEYKNMQIQQILLSTMQISIEIGGEYSKYILNRQTEIRIEAQEQQKKQAEAEKELTLGQKILKGLGIFGELLNIIAAAFAVGSTATATGATGGAAAPALVSASFWLAAAITSFAHRVNEAIPEDKRLIPLPEGNAAIAFTAILMIANIGGMAATAGASTYFAGSQALIKSATEANTAATVILEAQKAGSFIAPDILNAAQNAQTATDALLAAIRTGGTVSQEVADAAVQATQVFDAAITAFPVLPVALTKDMASALTKAAESIASAAESVVLKNFSEIENLAKMVTMVQDILSKSALGSGIFSAASTTAQESLRAVYQKKIADAKAVATEKEADLSDINYILDTNTQNIQELLRATTDFEKAMSGQLKQQQGLNLKISDAFKA